MKEKYPLDFCEHDVPIDEFCEICDADEDELQVGDIFIIEFDDDEDFDDKTF